MADRAALKAARENLTICRRDTRKLISAAVAEGAAGDWLAIEAMYNTLSATMESILVSGVIDRFRTVIELAVSIALSIFRCSSSVIERHCISASLQDIGRGTENRERSGCSFA